MLGEGIIKGMAVTAKNFLGSYVSEERLTTIQYPEERQKLPEASRQFPFLVFDGSDPMAGLRCVACQRFARRNVRRSVFTSRKARTRSRIISASRRFIRPSLTLISRFA